MSEFKNIKRVLIANRGEIAIRIIRTCQKYGLASIAVYSKEDLESLHVSSSDEAYLLSGTGAAAYTNINEIVQIAIDHKADVVIPGYGFLSENSDFAAKLAECGILFAGPSSESVRRFGLKHLAREIATECDVPVVPGTGLICDADEITAACSAIGYPVILKATAGGGGMGLKVCRNEVEVRENFAEVTSRGNSLFSNDGVFVEKYIEKGRHIEVQLVGNGLGDVVTYGERECSIQRRHQKVIEEAPSPFVEGKGAKYGLRAKLTAAAKRLASTIKYKSAGTVEFLVDDSTGEYYFLEVNTRLQVEHGITELVYGVDLVYLMLLQSEYETFESGTPAEILTKNLTYSDGVEVPHGHAIEVRVYAENPIKDFAPCPGILHNVSFPNYSESESFKLRIDHWIETGGKISPYFDPLLAKVMVWSPQRTAENMVRALKDLKIQGPVNNIEYCISVLESQEFSTGETLTSFLADFELKPHLIEFEQAGAYTTIQDLPGRRTVRAGVPQGGPADPLALQIANIVVGNDKNCEALEINIKGPTIKFHKASVVALAGAPFGAFLDGKDVPFHTELFIPAGSILEVNEPTGQGCKCYLAFKGGFPGVAEYLGSKSCIPSLCLGGHQGRILFLGDCLEIAPVEADVPTYHAGYSLPETLIPDYSRDENVIRVTGGPHDTAEIVSDAGMKQLLSVDYSVNFNSNRGAMRLDGPEMIFSRPHGGDGGGHPSNILEYPYPTCGLSTVGATMILFGLDGATMSGFTCVAVPVEVDFWKFGQAGINSKLHFELVTYEDAIELMRQREKFISEISKRPTLTDLVFSDSLSEYKPVKSQIGTPLYRREKGGMLPELTIRQAGERMVVIDFGIEKFDLLNNGRQQMLQISIEKALSVGQYESVECTSGAMAVTFDPLRMSRSELVEKIISLEADIPPVEELKLPSKVYRLPLCFDHSALDHCLERYMHSQRSHASYLPKNTDYLMRANCLESMEEFKKCFIEQPEVVVAVSFLCANVLLAHTDPRLRLSTSKYNPTRTSTPAGTLSSGSVLQSIYPVESPGGYMIWGVSLPNWYWDTFARIHEKPWPLHTFDQVIFYEVSEKELERINNLVLTKKLVIEPEMGEFDFSRYKRFLESIDGELTVLQERKKRAFAAVTAEEEKDFELWIQEKKDVAASKAKAGNFLDDPDCLPVLSHMPSNVFKINFAKGDIVTAEDVLVILEAMKMEIPVKLKDKKACEEQKYEVLDSIVSEGDIVNPGDTLVILKRMA